MRKVVCLVWTLPPDSIWVVFPLNSFQLTSTAENSIWHLRQQALSLPPAGMSSSQNICFTKWKGVGAKNIQNLKSWKVVMVLIAPVSKTGALPIICPMDGLLWKETRLPDIQMCSLPARSDIQMCCATTHWGSVWGNISPSPNHCCAQQREFSFQNLLSENPCLCYPHMTKSVEPDILDNRILWS